MSCESRALESKKETSFTTEAVIRPYCNFKVTEYKTEDWKPHTPVEIEGSWQNFGIYNPPPAMNS